MAPRLRHCVECPECCTRYLIGFSPYRNGSTLAILVSESSEEYQLSCSCSRPPVASRCSRNQLKSYAVSNRAFNRGYGPPSEISFVSDLAASSRTPAFSPAGGGISPGTQPPQVDLTQHERKNPDETDHDKA